MLDALKRSVWRISRVVRSRLGIGSRLDTPDRAFQERSLIPEALQRGAARKVLYVGVSWYTYHYYKRLFRNVRLTTLDIAPEQAVYGARDHIVGTLDNPDLALRAPFEVIFLLGVVNYGIDTPEQLKKSLEQTARLLGSGGACYMTVEESIVGGAAPLDEKTVAAMARSLNWVIEPLSDWFPLPGGKSRTRFYRLVLASG